MDRQSVPWPLRNANPAFGAPGLEPRWTSAAKDAVGTAYSTGSHVWYTVRTGIVSEIYFPTIDRPQIRDLQFLVTDGATFFHEESRDLQSQVEPLSENSLGFRIRTSDPQGRYAIIKEVIGNPHQNALLLQARIEGDEELVRRLKVYALLAPHLDVGGWNNSGFTGDLAGERMLVAVKHDTWLAFGATPQFVRTSCGFVGASDGWTDLAGNFQLDWEFDSAEHGNIALTAELDVGRTRSFTVAIGFGDSLHSAATTLLQSLDVPFAAQRKRFIEQWERVCRRMLPLGAAAFDGGRVRCASHSVLLAHEDKSYQGAMIASLSIPWGEARGDNDIGGYHLVWTRDMCNSATGLLASGNSETALRALTYLASSQQEDGGFHQNFWINGQPHWRGVQLDEVAFPVLLAWRLHAERALRNFDPFPMVMRAARYMIKEGPATQQERWEENSGYSPSTLAANIAALTCAALFARERGDMPTAEYIQQYADFLECHIEPWTVTTEGTLVPTIPRHYIRLLPTTIGDSQPDEDPNRGVIPIRNRQPGTQFEFPAKDIVDAGFLELVRYGIRRPGDPLIEDSLRVVDAVLKVETPLGPCWRRYNHDGYGQRAGGEAYAGWGVGRPWPLLTGERAHYELAAGRDVRSFVRALERFANPCGLLPEQIWDGPDNPEAGMRFGFPTGAAMPLLWAQAEYLKLLRSIRDGVIFDRIAPVAERYLNTREQKGPGDLETESPDALRRRRRNAAHSGARALYASRDRGPVADEPRCRVDRHDTRDQLRRYPDRTATEGNHRIHVFVA